MLRVLASSLLLILSVASVGAADADWRKLDARTRSALSRLRAGAPPARLTDVRAAVNAAGELDVFIVGPVTREELEAAGARVRTEAKGVFTAWVPAGAVAGVAALSRVRRIEGAVPVSPQLDASIPVTNVHIARGPGPAFAGFNGQGILLGVVDTGVDYGHGDFDDPSGNTRLIGVWDQTDTLGPSPLVTGTGPYPYGSDWAPAAIDDGSARETDTFPHGTHVLGIAGGDGSQTGGATPPFTYAGVAPRADLVMVETNFTSTGVVDGVRYVFDRATARDQNAVVNLSLGSQFGPHDGTSAFETSLSALTGPGRVVVAAAGNDRGRQYHAEVFAAGGGSDATLSVSNSATGREVVVAGYYESTENVSVRITTPDATVIGPIPLGGTNGATGQVTANGTVYVENGVSTSGGGDPEIFVDIEVGPGQNMNGIWTFTLIPVALGTANGEVDLWRAFSGNAHAVFVQGNDNSELVVEPGNADSLVTVAAFLTKTTWIDCGGRTVMDGTQPLGTLAGFSSPGPTRTGGQKPDLAGPGLDIASTTSFDVGPSCPPTESIYLNDGMNHFVDAGTSMAAPHVAGVVALLMQRYGAISPSFVKQYLAEHAIVDANTGAVWNPDWGHGKLFLGDLASTGVEPLPGADAEFTLALRPNPTAGPVTIEFAVARATDVRVTVLDLQGRELAELARGPFAPGRYRVAWSGASARSGLYWVRYQGPGFDRSQRLVLAR